MAKLQKNFTTEADDLKAYITCACPAVAVGMLTIRIVSRQELKVAR